MSLTLIVVSLAGAGLVTMMQSNSKAEAETLRRTELNRALDFIADEIRMANSVTAASSYSISPASPTCAVPTPVLYLTIPNTSSPPNNVVYYLNDINSCTGTTNLWLKPATINRVDNVSSTSIPGSNGSELVDAVTTVAVTPNCPAALPNVSPTPDINGKVKGFYACTNNSNSRLVELHLLGKLTDAYGTYIGLYEVSNRVFARSATPSPSPSPSP